MKLSLLPFVLGGLAASVPAATHAQATGGDGLRGDYYDGLNFEHLVQSRRDARLDFYWYGEQPVGGVPAEEFTVRWTGWLVPPVTGHYVLHLAVDDGARLWLDNKQLLNEWRGQPLGYYDVPVELQGGRPYRLRLDYCQYSREATARLLWERPRRPEAPPVSSWRNLWGMAANIPTFASRPQEVIPTRYLYSHVPPKPAAALATRGVVVHQLLPATPPLAPMPATKPPSLAAQPRVASGRRLRKSRPQPKTDTVRTERLATQLLRGQAITMRTLYFEQGKATLPAPVLASLDTLAQVLERYPTLRLEVQGHTDNQGDPALNQQLSLRRAEAVCQYLSTHGIAATRLSPLGLGGTQPVADNNLPAERPRNRRVVLRPLP